MTPRTEETALLAGPKECWVTNMLGKWTRVLNLQALRGPFLKHKHKTLDFFLLKIYLREYVYMSWDGG